MKTIAVDFDGVIHKYSEGYKEGTPDDVPVEGAKEALIQLRKRGFDVVIFTARDNLLEVKEWLNLYDFGEYLVTNNKPKAIAYIDDRAIRFTNWQDMLNYF